MKGNSATSDITVMEKIRKNIEMAVISRNYKPAKDCKISHIDPANHRFKIEILKGNPHVMAQEIKDAIKEKFVYMPNFQFVPDGTFIRLDFENEFRRLSKRKNSAA
jgi:hypothetical protein